MEKELQYIEMGFDDLVALIIERDKTILALEQVKEKMEGELELKNEMISELQINALSNNLKVSAKVTKPVIPGAVEVDGKKYKFKMPTFHVFGNKYTAEEAATDKELLRKIIAIKGQNTLKEVQ